MENFVVRWETPSFNTVLEEYKTPCKLRYWPTKRYYHIKMVLKGEVIGDIYDDVGELAIQNYTICSNNISLLKESYKVLPFVDVCDIPVEEWL